MPSAADDRVQTMCPEPGEGRAPEPGTVWAVVLAGGASRRFGSDKLAASLGPRRLLELAVSGLPAGSRLIVVGPARTALDLGSAEPIRYVREDPPGGGPAAGMIAGLIAVDAGAAADDVVLVLPGDAPRGGRAATELLAVLLDDPAADAVVGVDASGREQPLQLALRRAGVRRLMDAAGPDRGQDASARALVAALVDRRRVGLAAELTADVDTPTDLADWAQSGSGSGPQR
ncbi:hypothetical protein GCM10022236_14110 [Microlunatus ginsengisoli]|uniref:MobA-like NTP transferase domain-containing protein n=2 Tax=Microlunatus ginsengisoli TaxID=363863 RepID=A0ABP6ZNJ2_9ACTN